MTGKVQTINIGGVEYAKNEVAKHEIETKDGTNSKGVWEQYKEYKVTLKDGTRVTYKEQEKERQATIDILDNGSVSIFGLKNATLKGTNNNDDYKLHGCEGTYVNVAGDSKNSQLGLMLGAEYKSDKVEYYNRELHDGNIQKSKNNNISYDKDDKVSGYGITHKDKH